MHKRRTDISAAVTNPIFSANTFHLPFSAHQSNGRLQFACFVVTDRTEGESNG